MKNQAINIMRLALSVIVALLSCQLALAQTGGVKIQGKVFDSNNEAIIGANIKVKGSPTIGTTSNIDGVFKLTVPNEKSVIVVSYVGMQTMEMEVGKKRNFNVTLTENAGLNLGEVVVVGYGQQKKASVTGSITQTTGEVLERSGGVTNVGAALTGNLPGVVTFSSTGIPGADEPKIVIRTQSSWNNSDPLVLVDGIERDINTVDISSVKSVSVLKDASATAVYGVKGANGVILITTKRGQEGKAQVQIKADMTVKTVSKLPEKYDSYDALILRNRAIERELPIGPGAWTDYRPMQIIDKYRHPANATEWDRYPNVDWQDYLFRDMGLSYHTSVNVSGGSKFVRYFSSIDFVHEGDMLKHFDSGRGYKSGYGYNRVNVRSNLDFTLTKTTQFSLNLFGSNGQRTLPWGADNSGESSSWASAYKTAPDAMRPVYSNGMWGWYAPRNADVPNSAYLLATSGIEKRTTNKINTDFILTQDLGMVTKGLSARLDYSMDYRFLERERGVDDRYHSTTQRMWVNPDTGQIEYEAQVNPGTQLDPSNTIAWSTVAGNVDLGQTFRKIYYSAQLNYDRTFGKHQVTGLGLFSRESYATGGEFRHYREDWAFRATYNYALKYFAEFNGAYNGSEKFGPDYRFHFFPAVSAGWTLTEEPFMKKLKFIDMIKFRASWGQIGDDNVGGRFLYADQWAYGGNTLMGYIPADSPYKYYRLSSLGNKDVHWETVEKRNFGIDYSFIDGMLAGSVDIFSDKRTDILVSGNSQAIPSYFGVTPPMANLGRVDSHGYEFELRFNKKLGTDTRLWANFNLTHAINKVKFKDDPQLKPDYQKAAGHAIGQTYSYIDNGTLASWDDIAGSTKWETNDSERLPGDYSIVDFNGDGVINADDRVPYAYSGIPQNTYNATLGFEWKGFSCFVQFYGVNNVTREISFPTFQASSTVVYVEGEYWNKYTGTGLPMPRWSTKVNEANNGTRYLYDGSYLRLKNAEISYKFTGKGIERLGIKVLRVYLNGDNLLLWTDMPDDRESNFSGMGPNGAYPTVRRFNLGIDLTL